MPDIELPPESSTSPPPPSVPPPASSGDTPVGSVSVVVNRDGDPVPLCNIRVVSGVYDEVDMFVHPTANPVVFTDVPATVDGLLQAFCYPTLYPGCTAAWESTWPGGSFGGEMPADGSPFGPLTVIAGETTEVVIDITCAPASWSSPPPSTSSPPTCCPEIPWCAEGGGVVEHPVGTRPDGVVGRPWRTLELALANCPPAPPLVIECGGQTYSVPSSVVVSLVNPTGCAVANSGVSPDPLLLGPNGVDGCGTWWGGCETIRYDVPPMTYADGNTLCDSQWVVKPPTLAFELTAWLGIGGPPGTVSLRLKITGPPGGVSGVGVFPFVWESAEGWGSLVEGEATGSPPCAVYRISGFTGDWTDVLPELVGTLHFQNPNGVDVGTVDVYLSLA